MRHTHCSGKARRPVMVTLLLAMGALGAAAAQPPTPPTPSSPPLPAASKAAKTPIQERKVSLPARGLFVGDRLSASARERLTELILQALGLEVQVALVVPTGPWQIDGSGKDERSLTPARLNAVKQFLTERGVNPSRIYVESRIDQSAAEPRLDLQLMGRPAND